MGADIWIDDPWGPNHFREPYTGPVLLNYLGLSYWNDLRPRLGPGSIFPLELNDWLEAELLSRGAGRIGPDALEIARSYCRENNHPPRGTSEDRYIEAVMSQWTQDYNYLLGLIRQSSASKRPLIMSL